MMADTENMKELKEAEMEGVAGGKKRVARRDSAAAEDNASGRSQRSGHGGDSKDKGIVGNPLPFPQDRRP